MRKFVLAAVALLVGCGGEQRQACYAQAELAAHAEAEAQCNALGFKFANCPDADAILERLQSRQEICPQ
jgi:hypothetical protein